MQRTPVPLLSALLLMISACAVSNPPKAGVTELPKVRLTDGELEETKADPRPEGESASRDESIRFVKESILTGESSRIQGPSVPGSPLSPVLPAPGAYPWFPR